MNKQVQKFLNTTMVFCKNCERATDSTKYKCCFCKQELESDEEAIWLTVWPDFSYFSSEDEYSEYVWYVKGDDCVKYKLPVGMGDEEFVYNLEFSGDGTKIPNIYVWKNKTWCWEKDYDHMTHPGRCMNWVSTNVPVDITPKEAIENLMPAWQKGLQVAPEVNDPNANQIFKD